MEKLKEIIDEQFDFWLDEKEIDDKEPLDTEEPDDPIAEHDLEEFEIVEEQNKHFEQDNPRD